MLSGEYRHKLPHQRFPNRKVFTRPSTCQLAEIGRNRRSERSERNGPAQEGLVPNSPVLRL